MRLHLAAAFVRYALEPISQTSNRRKKAVRDYSSYLHALRLNRARRELRLADSEFSCVSDVANRWNFWHMGLFAADYRRLFGGLPS